MIIIFDSLPKYLVKIIIFLKRFGHQIYYLTITEYETKETEEFIVEKLKKNDVLPLPLEGLPYIENSISELFFDIEKEVENKSNKITSFQVLQALQSLFPNIPCIEKKLQIIIHSMIVQQMYNTGRINIWANFNNDKNILFINTNYRYLFNPKLSPNVRQIFLPFGIFERAVKFIKDFIPRYINLILGFFTKRKKFFILQEKELKENNQSRVAFVVHMGLKYGNLFKKDLYYSDQINSHYHAENMLHIDYSGFKGSSDGLLWTSFGNHRQSFLSIFYYAFIPLIKGIGHIRHLKQVLGLLVVIRSYVVFRSFLSKIQNHPNLEIALIDYDILCPKELLLAFESKGITTIATQDRFITAFEVNMYGFFMTHYLCCSEFAAKTLSKSSMHIVENYHIVGQYRSDKLVKMSRQGIPEILEKKSSETLKVITALGYHTHLEWHKSQSDPLLNWTAHYQFLDDMCRLAEDIPRVFIILRYKLVDWMQLPIFEDIVKKIIKSDNMTISTDYENFDVSYNLCANSDLVIAKHTSLADECLSVGIPVLFHEYTHNLKNIFTYAFDYSPTKIMCYNYEELLERARIVLSGTPNEMTEDYEYLRKVVYGDLGDGKVRERVHAFIEGLLSEEENTK